MDERDDELKDGELSEDFDPTKKPASGLDDLADELDDGAIHEELPADPLLVGDEEEVRRIDDVLDEEEADDDDSMDDKDNDYGI